MGEGGGDSPVTAAATTGASTVTPAVTPATTPAGVTTVPVTVVTPATQAAYIDKYAGVWTTGCLTNSGVNESGRLTSTISKKSDSVLTFALTATRVTGRNCTGTALPKLFPDVSNDLTYVATVSEIDRFTYAGNGKSTLKITGAVLNLGNEMSLDAAGYPVIDFKDLDLAFNKN